MYIEGKLPDDRIWRKLRATTLNSPVLRKSQLLQLFLQGMGHNNINLYMVQVYQNWKHHTFFLLAYQGQSASV